MPPRIASLVACLLVAALVLIPACGGGGGGAVGSSEFNAARVAALRDIGNNYIMPMLERLKARGDALATAVTTLAGAVNQQNLDDVQQAWRNARETWNQSEAILFGRVSQLRLAVSVDASPTNTGLIDADIAGTVTIDNSYLETIGSTRKGFFALEYLLFDPVGGDAAVLDSITIDANAARRLQYIDAAAENMAQILCQIRDIWSPAGDNFLDAFVNAGTNTSAYAGPKDALDALVNHVLVLTEIIADVRLGRPLGKTFMGVPQPAGVEAGRSGNSRADVINDILGVQSVYLGLFDGGDIGTALTEIVRVTSPTIDNATRNDIQMAHDMAMAIPETLQDSATMATPTVEAAFNQAKAMRERMVIDTALTLNTTLTFSPNDGD